MLRLRKSFTALALASASFLAACAAPPVSSQINDPHEAQNRKTHAMNVAVDKALLRPIGGISQGGAGKALGHRIQSFSSNLDLPNTVVNDLLQAKLDNAVGNTIRFAINSTIGIAGLWDPASAMGLPKRQNDFGATLHVWGAGEGAYVELPLLGPSTERDMVGDVVDLFLDPLGPLMNRDQKALALLAKLGAKATKRGEFAHTVDSVLYDSADSYAQSRLLYLQNRRFDLGQTQSDETNFEDPYAN